MANAASETSSLRINQLDSAHSPASHHTVTATVTLLWPYSSSTRKFALLLADPDFRLRKERGQVRVQFSGPSAEAVARSQIGIGDVVVLGLHGATWTDSTPGLNTPGRSVEAELLFQQRLFLSISRNGREHGTVDIDEPLAEHPEVDLVASTPTKKDPKVIGEFAAPDTSIASPAPVFHKRARASSSRIVNEVYDPFGITNEDNRERKRPRKSWGQISRWKVVDKEPSPAVEDGMDVETLLQEDTATVEQRDPIQNRSPPRSIFDTSTRRPQTASESDAEDFASSPIRMSKQGLTQEQINLQMQQIFEAMSGDTEPDNDLYREPTPPAKKEEPKSDQFSSKVEVRRNEEDPASPANQPMSQTPENISHRPTPPDTSLLHPEPASADEDGAGLHLQMLPPSFPRLQTSTAPASYSALLGPPSAIPHTPKTPEIHPLKSNSLPLPSPFPGEHLSNPIADAFSRHARLDFSTPPRPTPTGFAPDFTFQFSFGFGRSEKKPEKSTNEEIQQEKVPNIKPEIPINQTKDPESLARQVSISTNSLADQVEPKQSNLWTPDKPIRFAVRSPSRDDDPLPATGEAQADPNSPLIFTAKVGSSMEKDPAAEDVAHRGIAEQQHDAPALSDDVVHPLLEHEHEHDDPAMSGVSQRPPASPEIAHIAASASELKQAMETQVPVDAGNESEDDQGFTPTSKASSDDFSQQGSQAQVEIQEVSQHQDQPQDDHDHDHGGQAQLEMSGVVVRSAGDQDVTEGEEADTDGPESPPTDKSLFPSIPDRSQLGVKPNDSVVSGESDAEMDDQEDNSEEADAEADSANGFDGNHDPEDHFDDEDEVYEDQATNYEPAFPENLTSIHINLISDDEEFEMKKEERKRNKRPESSQASEQEDVSSLEGVNSVAAESTEDEYEEDEKDMIAGDGRFEEDDIEIDDAAQSRTGDSDDVVTNDRFAEEVENEDFHDDSHVTSDSHNERNDDEMDQMAADVNRDGLNGAPTHSTTSALRFLDGASDEKPVNGARYVPTPPGEFRASALLSSSAPPPEGPHAEADEEQAASPNRRQPQPPSSEALAHQSNAREPDANWGTAKTTESGASRSVMDRDDRDAVDEQIEGSSHESSMSQRNESPPLLTDRMDTRSSRESDEVHEDSAIPHGGEKHSHSSNQAVQVESETPRYPLRNRQKSQSVDLQTHSEPIAGPSHSITEPSPSAPLEPTELGSALHSSSIDDSSTIIPSLAIVVEEKLPNETEDSSQATDAGSITDNQPSEFESNLPITPEATQTDQTIPESLPVIQSAQRQSAIPPTPEMTQGTIVGSFTSVDYMAPSTLADMDSQQSDIGEQANTPAATEEPSQEHAAADYDRNQSLPSPSGLGSFLLQRTRELPGAISNWFSPRRSAGQQMQAAQQIQAQEQQPEPQMKDLSSTEHLTVLQNTVVRAEIPISALQETSTDGDKAAAHIYEEAETQLLQETSSNLLPTTEDAMQNEDSFLRRVRAHIMHDSTGAAQTSEETAGFRTALSYYPPLCTLPRYVNSSSPFDQSVDILAVVTKASTTPKRADKGPRHYHTQFSVVDQSSPDVPVRVQCFRPWKAALPKADVGDVVLLRQFDVLSTRGGIGAALRSGEESAWCVWRIGKEGSANGPRRVPDAAQSDHSAYWDEQQHKPKWGGPSDDQGDHASQTDLQQLLVKAEEVNGPPVEICSEERAHARDLYGWWSDTARKQRPDAACKEHVEEEDAAHSEDTEQQPKEVQHAMPTRVSQRKNKGKAAPRM